MGGHRGGWHRSRRGRHCGCRNCLEWRVIRARRWQSAPTSVPVAPLLREPANDLTVILWNARPSWLPAAQPYQRNSGRW